MTDRDPGAYSPFGKPIRDCQLYQVITDGYARGVPMAWPLAVTRAERVAEQLALGDHDIKIVGVQYWHRGNTVKQHPVPRFFVAQDYRGEEAPAPRTRTASGLDSLKERVAKLEKDAAESLVRKYIAPEPDLQINITVTIWEGQYRKDLAVMPWRHSSKHDNFADARGMLAALRGRAERTIVEKPGERVAEILVWVQQGGTNGNYRDQATVDNFDAAEAVLVSQRAEIAGLA
jgi:hypothetical protein